MEIFTSSYILMFYTGLFIVLLKINYSESQRPFQDLAWLKPATQIGTYQNNVTAYGPQWATDGLNGDTDPYSFVDSGDDNIPAWWKVDLETDCIIKAVGYVMSNREGRNRYLETMRAAIEKTNGSQVECGTYDSTGKNVTYLFMTCNSIPPATGRKVIIGRNGGYQPRYMAATEFLVYGIFLFGNQALEKPTNQSQIGYINPQLRSDLAVDKNFTSCSLAIASAGQMAWWQVDLQYYVSVLFVKVFISDTNKYTSYFEDVEITVDNTSTLTSQNIFARYPSNNGSINITFASVKEITGRFVTFRRNPTSYPNNQLVLCNVQVIGRFIGELTSSGRPSTIPSPTSSLTSSTFLTNISSTTISIESYSTSISTFYSSESSPTSTTSSYSIKSTSTTTTSKLYILSNSTQRISSDLINPVTISYTTEATSQQPEIQRLQTGFIILIVVLAAVVVVSSIVVGIFIGRSKACRKGDKMEDRPEDNHNSNNNQEINHTLYYSHPQAKENRPLEHPYDPLNQDTQPNENTNVEPPEEMYRCGTEYVEIQPGDTIKSGVCLNQPIKVNKNARDTIRNMSRNTIYANVSQNSTISSL